MYHQQGHIFAADLSRGNKHFKRTCDVHKKEIFQEYTILRNFQIQGKIGQTCNFCLWKHSSHLFTLEFTSRSSTHEVRSDEGFCSDPLVSLSGRCREGRGLEPLMIQPSAKKAPPARMAVPHACEYHLLYWRMAKRHCSRSVVGSGMDVSGGLG
eukprot:TRINITY_DN2548_c0_g1_i2.p1 TRINITY_DN2548_c0_g1~~TRINITY_DN2548_c0_g1_i2.p1  ORF type:complete len:154 (+),score=18.40 TRINITY_DN2548_c0_g1_i2:1100-1561(+)